MRDIYGAIEDIRRDAAFYIDRDPMERKHKGAIIGHLNKAMGGDMRRRLALFLLFRWQEEEGNIEMLSTRDLRDHEWHALRLWVDAYNEPDLNEWLPSERFVQEAKVLADFAEVHYYRTHVIELDPIFDEYPEAVQEVLRLGGELKEESDIDPLTRFERFSRRKKDK